MSIQPSQFDLLSKMLDAAAMRQKIIAQNVANVNTPGYRRQEVQFDDQLAALLRRDEDMSATQLAPRVSETAGLPERVDGNNVDIDMEMAELTENVIKFDTYSQILATRVAMLRSAITGQP